MALSRKSLMAHSIAQFLLLLVASPTIPGAFESHCNFPSHLKKRPFKLLLHGNPQRASGVLSPHWCHLQMFLATSLVHAAKFPLKMALAQVSTGNSVSWPEPFLSKKKIQPRKKATRMVESCIIDSSKTKISIMSN